MAPVCDTFRGRSPTKKALLIGISYRNVPPSGQQLDPIPTSIPNVKKFMTFLQDHWGYTDITLMTDEDDIEKKFQPTKENLKREMRALTDGVIPGDRRVFYYAGHSDQMPCRRDTEPDGMDETLVDLNGIKIRDNTLYKLLVAGLPQGSALTAVFDSCTSGTLLDLPHYECNGVYHPWYNKGKRGSHTLQNNVVRRNGRFSRPRPSSPPHSPKGSSDRYPGIVQTMSPTSATSEGTYWYQGRRTASPERQFVCEGWCCAQEEPLPHADVISISSSGDGQISWDASTRNGDSLSMTSSLVDILTQDPQLSYRDLMTRLNHSVYQFTMKMHRAVQEERRAYHKAHGKNLHSEGAEPEEEDKGEMNNFQDLQLGSLTPVDMARTFKF